ncbi:1,4-alpha-glucan branching protein [Kitasatospora sp. NBC_00315]|uniref:maltokinase N-terminal cap-like domain-containing protein n=1 Tax=Kitasatospora sp. NBC_00315 TaxID=2975963 RepID=UPI003248CA00
MAVVHRTTMNPTKVELLSVWLPTQPWYRGGARAATLAKAGGFRLDDPAGQVGIEFMVATDMSATDRGVSYLLPLTYRDAPLDDAGQALVGTSEHGVLGRRWIYDGAHDPVLVAQLLALMTGEAEPQAQSESDSADASVEGHFAGAARVAMAGLVAVANSPHGTDILIGTGPAPTAARLTIHLNRVLCPTLDEPAVPAPRPLGHVSAPWLLPDGTSARGVFAVADNAPS